MRGIDQPATGDILDQPFPALQQRGRIAAAADKALVAMADLHRVRIRHATHAVETALPADIHDQRRAVGMAGIAGAGAAAHRFGRRQLYPDISPGGRKTQAGAVEVQIQQPARFVAAGTIRLRPVHPAGCVMLAAHHDQRAAILAPERGVRVILGHKQHAVRRGRFVQRVMARGRRHSHAVAGKTDSDCAGGAIRRGHEGQCLIGDRGGTR